MRTTSAICMLLAASNVQATPANIVDIDHLKQFNMYIGSAYIGSQFRQWHVIFDTLSDWTLINGNFDVKTSTSHRQQFEDANQTTPLKETVLLEKPYEGQVFNETMCLKQDAFYQGGKRTLNSGRLCIRSYPFVLADDKEVVIDGTPIGGVLGLSPARTNHNYVLKLKEQGIINRAIVGINYEAWGDTHQRSRVSFGYIDFDEIEEGEDGANYYSNLGRDKWGLMMDDFYYNNVDMTEGQGPKIALLDSANVTIQLPEQVFDNTLVEMKKFETDGLKFSEDIQSDGTVLMKANKACDKIYDKMKPISFKLQTTQMVLKPQGYTYMFNEDQGYCQIGLERLKGVANEYRLGTLFLRNYYTGLDYDNDLIIIGVNAGMAKVAQAGLSGRVWNPYKPRYVIFKVVLIFLFITAIGSMIAYYLHRTNALQEEKRRVDARMRNVNRVVAQDNSDVESEEDAEASTQQKTNYLIQDSNDTLDEPLTQPRKDSVESED